MTLTTDTFTTPMTDRYDPIGLTQLEIRLAMVENGYNPTPLIGKKPLLNDWTNLVADAAMVGRWGNAGTGTGMVTAFTPVIDIDIENQQAAELIEQTIRECISAGEVLVRVGQFPRRAIPLRTDNPFSKKRCKFVAPDGTAHKIEVLANGQQLAAAGIHPDINKPFAWRGGRSPVNTARAALPLVTEAEVVALLDLCIEQLRTKLGWRAEVVSEPPGGAGAAAGPDAPLADRIAATQYKGECGLNQAILEIPMAELDAGVTVECVIEQCMALAKKCWEEIPEDDRGAWDWNAQRRQIEDSTYGHIKKNVGEHPRLAGALPERLLKIWRETEGRGGSPILYKKRGLGRGEWSVKDEGPTEEIPTMDPPPREEPKKVDSSINEIFSAGEVRGDQLLI
jgi:hypothetical protein